MINAGICTPLEMHVALLHDAKFDQNIQNVELVCRHAGRVRCRCIQCGLIASFPFVNSVIMSSALIWLAQWLALVLSLPGFLFGCLVIAWSCFLLGIGAGILNGLRQIQRAVIP